MTNTDDDYFLGTQDEELARLGLQHRHWKPTVLECWKRAGIRAGSRVIDVGAGPGHATVDLAEVVGPRGEVVAVDGSARSVEAGRALAAARGHANVRYHHLDLMSDALPGGGYDAAWCRWVTCFVAKPPVLLDRIAAVVRVGGVAVFHEYLQYETFRFAPSRPRQQEFAQQVLKGWRAAGGEPNIAHTVLRLLEERGFAIREKNPRVFCLRPADPMWEWPDSFVRLHLKQQASLGHIEAGWAEAVRHEFAEAAADPATIMTTPLVLEIIAEKLETRAPGA